MISPSPLVMVGASVRAAAHSARRAGLQPWAADLFADRDLLACCPVQRLSAEVYPVGFEEIMKNAPPGPWIFTGALENRPDLLQRWSQHRESWGPAADVIRAVRCPRRLRELLPPGCTPALRMPGHDPCPTQGRWLSKPLRSAGGRGIRFWSETSSRSESPTSHYWQEFVAGLPCAALFVGCGHRAILLGITEQLIGTSWLGGSGFQYAGSVGPLVVPAPVEQTLRALGDTLARLGLTGIFGLDFVLTDDGPVVVEINPRYTASVEVLEHALGIQALALHRAAFVDPAALREPVPARGVAVAKGIVFARQALPFPTHGPWTEVPTLRGQCDDLPAYADIPAPGERLERGWPILTLLVKEATAARCLEFLRERARLLDEHLRVCYG